MNVRLHEIGGSPRSRLLVVLDGPDYQRRTRLVSLLRRLVAGGDVKPHRVALVAPDDRLETYSASALYARSLAASFEHAVGLGSSLGALALLHTHRTHPDTFDGLFLQSGSYFRRRTDPQESTFARFGRVDRFVGSVLRGVGAHPVPATLTCGLDEENYANNAALARALAEQGYGVEFHAARGPHDWPTWKRALEAHLPALLRKVWR
jgi:enterochelin esterase-like enzyme